MKKCVVIGGGIAGLTSAVYLSKAGFNVEVIESSNKLGGRAYSFKDEKTGSVIDNGQHILMGCYKETLKFLRLINAEDNLIYQQKLSVPFLNNQSELFMLEATKLFYPLNLLLGLLNYNLLKSEDKFSLIIFFVKLAFTNKSNLKDITVEEWLLRKNQSSNLIKSFWEIVCVGTLNASIKKASAQLFASILKKIFFRGNFSAAMLVPKYGLSETYCNPAEEYLSKNNARLYFSENVTEIIIEDKTVKKIITTKRTVEDFDYVISAVPYPALLKFYSNTQLEKIKFENSCIVSIHIWIKENTLTEKFYGLVDSPIHWIFNNDDHLTLVISNANYLVEKDKTEIYEMCVVELKKYTNISKDNILHYKIIKEKRATFIPVPEVLSKRPGLKTNINNLFLAGDWTDTGLPATLEGAVLSGKLAADMVQSAGG